MLDADFANKEFAEALAKNPEFLSAWKVLNDAKIDKTIRTNVDELTLVSKHIDEIKAFDGGYKAWKTSLNNAGEEVFGSARQFVRKEYGQDFLNHITETYGKDNTGALSVIVKRFGDEGADLLKQGKSLDEIASALVRDRVLYRHIGSQAGYLDNLKKTGEIPAGYTTYFSADKFDDPIEAISKMQFG